MTLQSLLLAVALVLTPAVPAVQPVGFENAIFDGNRPADHAAQPAATPAPRTGPAPAPPPAAPTYTGPTQRVSSTAYCLTGTMANGQRASRGSVAMNGVPFGTRFEILSGPWAGRVVVVRDRIGHSSQFDLAMPGSCAEAIRYGRRPIVVRRLR